ncbi:hypothetical protein [Streptomyces sp. SAI-144]|uniref:hypothetical protein n=1 Tax=Streptomyces sp. SAI-144 TaxID=2940544 RepID=UPI0024741A60|nr:hypothetical protein [Streptomyces sp. SAI-144]
MLRHPKQPPITIEGPSPQGSGLRRASLPADRRPPSDRPRPPAGRGRTPGSRTARPGVR